MWVFWVINNFINFFTIIFYYGMLVTIQYILVFDVVSVIRCPHFNPRSCLHSVRALTLLSQDAE